MIVGVVVNPRSRRNAKSTARLEEAFAGRDDVEMERLDSFDALPQILDGFIARKASAIIISGGDGTVQAVQTQLAETLPPDRLPRLAILPDGTTNMDAADIGVQNPRSRTVLERLGVPEYCASTPYTKRRHTVRIENPADRSPLRRWPPSP